MTRDQVNTINELQTIDGIKVQTSWREVSLAVEPEKKFVRFTYKGEALYSGEIGRNYFRSSIKNTRKDADPSEEREADWLEARLKYICEHI